MLQAGRNGSAIKNASACREPKFSPNSSQQPVTLTPEDPTAPADLLRHFHSWAPTYAKLKLKEKKVLNRKKKKVTGDHLKHKVRAGKGAGGGAGRRSKYSETLSHLLVLMSAGSFPHH